MVRIWAGVVNDFSFFMIVYYCSLWQYAKDSGKHIEKSKLKVILTSPSHSPVLLPTNRVKKQEPSYATSVQKDKLLSGVENLSPHVVVQVHHDLIPIPRPMSRLFTRC
ncbi:unnamed protein product [Camellia sinensis]